MTTYHTAAEVAAEVLQRIETCTIAQGAETDLGRKVYHGRRTVDKTLVPCSTLIEGDDLPSEGNGRTDYLIEQRFAVLAYVDCDDANPNLAGHAAVRDIKRALFRTGGKADHTLGGKAKRVGYLGRQIAARADGERFILVVVEFKVEYVENVASP